MYLLNHEEDMTEGKFLSFPFSETSGLNKVKELNQPFYLPIAGGGETDVFMPFPRRETLTVT